MRLFLRRCPVSGGLLFFALLCAAALAGPKYFRGNAATLIVTNTADSGPGSLRQALADANNGDLIQFDAALNGQTINLTSAELVIDKNVTISGPGPAVLTVSRASGTFRIFHIIPGHIVIIEGIKISGGFTAPPGGGVLNDQAVLTVNNCAVSNNFSDSAGGGIYNSGVSGTLTINNSTITGNLARGLAIGDGGQGGGIYNNGTLEIRGSTVSGNSVTVTPPVPGRAGGIFNAGTAEISNSTISGNMAGNSAGGIHNGQTMTLIDSTVGGNTVVLGGFGGGINNFGTLTIRGSTVSGNTTTFKGSGFGGGIASSGPLTINNSTVSGNFAAASGGGIENLGGGAISNSTVSGNSAGDGGGIHNGGATLQLGNCILKAGASGTNISNSGGTITSDGYNLSSDNGGGFLTATGDQINTDPLLGPLQDNGGPTFTHDLLSGSLAIDAGDPKFTPPPFTDQRGYLRVFNGRIEIGSLEVQPVPTPSPTPTATPCTGTIVWSENFDELPAGTPGPCWTISTVNPDTPPNDAFVPDPDGISDCAYDFPGITIPAASAVLRFRNNFNTDYDPPPAEVFWDGGVLEVSTPSISGGDFLDITDPLVGGSFLSGGYTGEISGVANNPLAGRLAWSGDSGGYIDTVVNLGPNLTGQTITLRLRFGSDGEVGAPGWRVDTMTITDGVCATPTPTPTPTPTSTPTPTPTPGPATHFAVVAPSAVPQNWYFDFTVTALDQFNNTVTHYAGTVHFTTTSPGGNHLPADSTLTSGTGTFSATLAHTGNQTITARDLSNASITGTSNLIFVIPKGPQPTPTPPPPTPTPSPIPARPLNLSTRLLVQTGDNVGIGGFIITGPTPKQVVVRGIGPSLAQFGVPNALADPVMELHGPAGFTTIVNDNWRDTQATAIIATGIPPTNDLESAILVTLAPGNYTAIVKGKNDTSGVGLVEVYDIDQAAHSQLANISTRGFVGTGADVMIGGFILGAGNNTNIVIRGLGPSLAAFGITGVLADPTLEVRDSNGVLLASNDNCPLPPPDPLEACIEVLLPPGAFTAILAGKDGGTGIGLLEIYNLN